MPHPNHHTQDIAQTLATAHRTGTAWQPTEGWPEIDRKSVV